MFTDYTYQDWQRDGLSADKLDGVISQYKASRDFRTSLDALAYFRGENPEIMRKTVMQLEARETRDSDGTVRKKGFNTEVVGCRVSSNFLFRFVTQENQFLLGNGVTLEDDPQKDKLGAGFDTVLSQMGEKALLQGVCWGYWNADHMEIIPACTDALNGFVALLDEQTGAPMAGVQFCQLANDKPMVVRLFEEGGVTVLTKPVGGALTVSEPRRAYKLTRRVDALGEAIIGGSNYCTLPVIPLYANPEKRSELTVNVKTKIDLYDVILSDFGDNLARTNDVYWVINNFGGTSDEIVAMLAEINRIKATYTEAGVGSQSTAEPHTIEVPYAARQTALDILKRELYSDFMALDMDALTGGSLTNVAIQTATANLNLKCDRYEWQCFAFVQQVLRLTGVETEQIRFQRRSIANQSELVQNISVMRADIDRKTALKLNPYIQPDEIDDILTNMDAESVSGLSGLGALQDRASGGEPE